MSDLTVRLTCGTRELVMLDDVPSGFLIEPDGFTGWDDGVEVQRENIERSGGHGSHDVLGRLGPRTVSLSGTCMAESTRELEQFRRQLMGTLGVGERGTLSVDHLGETWTASCQIGSAPSFRVAGGTGTARWQLSLWCADPRKYGRQRSFGPAPTLSDVFQDGTFPARPTVTVTATTSMTSGYGIWGDGSVVVVSEPCLVGTPHTVDMATGRVWKNGAVVLGAVADAHLLTVRPFTVQSWYLAPNVGVGAGTIRVDVTDTSV